MAEVILIVVVGFLCSIGIRTHTVARAVGSMATQVVRAGRDAVAVTGASLSLLFHTVSDSKSISMGGEKNKSKTYGFRSMEHSNIEIPQKQAAVIADATESIVSLVTSPGIESDGGDP